MKRTLDAKRLFELWVLGAPGKTGMLDERLMVDRLQWFDKWLVHLTKRTAAGDCLWSFTLLSVLGKQ